MDEGKTISYQLAKRRKVRPERLKYKNICKMNTRLSKINEEYRLLS